MTEQTNSHREGVEKQQGENWPVSVVLDCTLSRHFVILPQSFHQNSTVRQVACFYLFFTCSSKRKRLCSSLRLHIYFAYAVLHEGVQNTRAVMEVLQNYLQNWKQTIENNLLWRFLRDFWCKALYSLLQSCRCLLLYLHTGRSFRPALTYHIKALTYHICAV